MTNSVLLVLPIVLPMATGVLALFLRGRRRAQEAVSVLGALALLAVAVGLLARVWTSGIQATQMGGWEAPFGITLVADLFSAGLVAMGALVVLAAVVYVLGSVDGLRVQFGLHPLLHLMLMGVNGAFLTGDLFNMYVWFEVLLIASFVLLVLGNEERQLDGALKYVGINLISSVAFLSAIGLLYGVTGALNLADLGQAMAASPVRGTGLEAAIAGLFLVGFGIKAAFFPLYFWMPASYHTPPAAVGAVFAALLTKVGLYALVRVFTVVFANPEGYTQTVLLVMAGATMVAGVLGALVQRDVQRLLAFLVISAMGYILMGFAFYTELGLTGVVFYTLQDVLVKGTLFLLAGLMIQSTGARTLDQMGGLYLHRPLLGLLFIVPAFSLAGIPPFPGFWGKLTLLRAGLEAGYPVLVAVALAVSLLTLLAVAQVWARAFWRDVPDGKEAPTRPGRLLTMPVAALVLIVTALGLYAQPLYALAARGAATLADTQFYVQAVLGG